MENDDECRVAIPIAQGELAPAIQINFIENLTVNNDGALALGGVNREGLAVTGRGADRPVQESISQPRMTLPTMGMASHPIAPTLSAFDPPSWKGYPNRPPSQAGPTCTSSIFFVVFPFILMALGSLALAAGIFQLVEGDSQKGTLILAASALCFCFSVIALHVGYSMVERETPSCCWF
eukprot:TRINITY_DN23004_c0_g1_i1.p1 TRINITY_DN23004_c0_g1~~TRINITY_DN23004_c0_g1_i1.p1  ORF type:complete len:179 (+),score=2.10 TRINITY_DN23004_c0_g1_i1:31-567(+)